jgi:hypothetical protein
MRAGLALAVALAAGCTAPAPSSPPTEPRWRYVEPETPKEPALRATLVHLDPEPEGAEGLSEAGRLALKVLLETETFTSDAVGEGGELPLQAECFRILFREDEATARAAFHHLADHGMAAGKLFGLCGLWFLDREACEAACDELAGEGDDFTARVFEGCIIGERPVAGIVRRPPDADPERADIRGGAWPRMLRGGPSR